MLLYGKQTFLTTNSPTYILKFASIFLFISCFIGRSHPIFFSTMLGFHAALSRLYPVLQIKCVVSRLNASFSDLMQNISNIPF